MSSETVCPNCGAGLPALLSHARMVNCEFCGSSIVKNDEVVAKAGEAGVMQEAPALIALNVPIRLGTLGAFTATGHVRYDYGRGHWDEYHGNLADGTLVWVSVDEGDVVLQRPVPDSQIPVMQGMPRLGREVQIGDWLYTCSEVSSAEATAFRGQLPEPVAIGDTHMFANFSGEDGAAASLEMWEDQKAWFVGHWIDPFAVERLT